MGMQMTALVVFTSLFLVPVGTRCQTDAPAATEHIETAKELDARLTVNQRQRFEAAKRARQANDNQEALNLFKALLQEVPNDALIMKFTSDAAIAVGDSAYAYGLLKPLVQEKFEDWQAVSMLARAAAETGDKRIRDAAMINMTMLRQHGLSLPQYPVERVMAGQNVMTVICVLIPSPPYQPYYIGRVADSKGQIFMRVTLESSDPDQISFAKEHPKEAAAGVRIFTLDAYRETGLNQAGQRTESHATYKFFTGLPTYDTVHEEFLNVVNGKTPAITSRTGLIVPQ